MKRFGKAVIAVLVVSYISSGAAFLLGAYTVGRLLVLPALVVTGLAALGHLVTLDEDLPGEWSNPEGSRKVWLSSVAELFAKLGALTVAYAVLRTGFLAHDEAMPNKLLHATCEDARA